MMTRKKKPAEGEEAEPEEGKGKKKKKAKKEEPFEYQDRVNEKLMFAVAFLFGALGELLAMAIYRHKWYKFNFRLYIPLLAGINIVIGAVILYFLYTKGIPVSYINP